MAGKTCSLQRPGVSPLCLCVVGVAVVDEEQGMPASIRYLLEGEQLGESFFARVENKYERQRSNDCIYIYIILHTNYQYMIKNIVYNHSYIYI